MLEADAVVGGGGRGGSGHHAGGGRSSPAQRTPSMSRSGNVQKQNASRNSHIRPSTPATNRNSRTNSRPEIRQPSRPATRDRNQNLQSPTRAGTFDRSQAETQLRSYAANHQGRKIDSGRIANAREAMPSRTADNIRPRQEQINRARQELRQYNPSMNRDGYFNQNFFDRHDFRPRYYAPGYRFWGAASWAAASSWLGNTSGYPNYYYPSGEYYAVTDANVNETPAYTYTEQQQQSYSLPPSETAISAPTSQTSTALAGGSDEWLPLGVFALGSSLENAGSSNRFVQLAMNREGHIDGAGYNATTDNLQNITGIIDKDSQQVTLLLANNIDSPIATTGLYNLTTGDTPLQLRFHDGSEQSWYLLRLEE